MIRNKVKNKIINERGITLVSLVITIALMLIIASTTAYISLDRFKFNNFKKMSNDIDILEDKTANYYLKYGYLPVLRFNNEPITYDSARIDFPKNDKDNSTYYILDLELMAGISLNYGKEGYEACKNYASGNSGEIPYNAKDLYIINEHTHTIYYVEGIELDGEKYYYTKPGGSLTDNIPPSKPQINIISGEKNDAGTFYKTAVEIEIIPGEDGWSGIGGTKYSLDNGSTWNELGTTRRVITLSENGTYTVLAKTYDNAGNYSEVASLEQIELHITHIWNEGEITKEPTTTETGIMTYTCTICGETKTETIEKLEDTHTCILDDGTVTEEAKCTTTGIKTYKCTICGKTKKTETIKSLGHNWNEGVVDKAPTTTEEGIRTYTCTRCSATYTEIIGVLEEDNHWCSTYNYSTLEEATCTKDGWLEGTCRECGKIYTEQIFALGHDYKVKTTSATCTSAGTTKYECSRCGDTYDKSGDAALGHNYKVEETIAATCTEAGTTKYKCSRCGDTYNESGDAALGHNYKVEETIAATCTKAGTTKYKCSRCSATKEEDTAKTSHKYATRTENPTCTKAGKEITYCSVCNITISTSTINKQGHDMRVQGYPSYICEHRCSATYRCSRTGCNVTYNVVGGHVGYHMNQIRYPSLITYDFYCAICGYNIYGYNKNIDNDRIYQLFTTYEESYYEAHNAAWYDLWQYYCDCENNEYQS